MRQLFSNEIGIMPKRVFFFTILFILAWLGLRRIIPSSILQVSIIVGILYILIGYQPLGDIFRSVSSFYKYFSTGLLTVLILGQVVRQDHRTFPFINWRMYGTVAPSANPIFYEYFGKLRSGNTIPFYPAQVLAAAGGRIDSELADQIEDIQAEQDASRQYQRMMIYKATLKALADLYNKTHEDDPIITISVSKYAVPLENYQKDSLIERQFLFDVDVSG